MGTPNDEFSSLWGFDSDDHRHNADALLGTQRASKPELHGPASSLTSSGLSAAAGPFFSKRARQIQKESGVGRPPVFRDAISATPSSEHLSDLFQKNAVISPSDPSDSASQSRGRARAGTLPSSWDRNLPGPSSSSHHPLTGSRFADKLGSDLRDPKGRSGASSPLGPNALHEHATPLSSRLRSASNASQSQNHGLPDLARQAFHAGPSSLASASNASEGSPSESSTVSRLRSDSLASNVHSDPFAHSNIFSPWAGSSPELKGGKRLLPLTSTGEQYSRGRGATIANPPGQPIGRGSTSLEGLGQEGLRTLDYLGLDDTSATDGDGSGDAGAANALDSLLATGRDRASTLAVPSADWRSSPTALLGNRNRSSTFAPSGLDFTDQQQQSTQSQQRSFYQKESTSASSQARMGDDRPLPGSGSAASRETAAAVAAAVAAGRARAISMGRLDAPDQFTTLPFYQSGTATPPAYPALHNEYVSRDDLYAYALEHGLDPAAFTAAATTHAGVKVVPSNSDRLPASRLRAGTVAALGGIGGRARTEQELIRMAARGASTSKPYGGGQGSLAAHDFFDGRLPTPPNLPPSRSASGHVSSSRAGPPSPAHSHRLSPSIAHASAAASADRGQAPQQQPTRSLWVGNLSSSTTGQKLTQAFAQYGAIESMRLLPDKECGFVNFVEVADAIQARDDILNRLGGRVRGLCAESSTPIKIGYGKIDESSPNLKARAQSPQGLGTGERDDAPPTRALWVGSIPSSTSPAALLSIFQPFGPVESARILTHKNCGFVNFERIDDAVRARKLLNGHDILGPEVGAVRVGFAKVPSKLEDGSYPGEPNSEGYSIATDQLNNLKGSNGVPVEQQMKPGNLESYRSHFVTEMLHGQLNDIEQNRGDPATSGVTASSAYGLTAALAHSHHRSAPHSGLSASSSIVPSSDKGGVPLPSELQPRATVTDLQLLMVHLSDGEPESTVDAHLNVVSQFRPPATYYTSIPVVSESNASRRFDTAKLRDMRKFIEQGQCHQVDIDNLALSLLDSIVDLASDYIGNTLVQKFFERCSEPIKTRMLELVAPSLATVGIHKNGTWAAQKILDMAQSPEQRSLIAHHLRPFIPPLLLDQFGNYVVQCLLPYGAEPEAGDELRSRSDFIFDAMVDRCWEIAQGRFGARSMRACLESPLATNLQKKRVAMAVVLNSVPLATSPNGSLLLNWLLDASNLPGRYRLLSPRFTPHLAHLCTHKLASLTVLRIVNQRLESEAAHSLLDALFNSAHDGILEEVLSEKVHGSQFVTRVLSSSALEPDRREKYAEQTRRIVLQHNYMSVPAYRKLVEDLGLQFVQGPSASSGPRRAYDADAPLNAHGYGDAERSGLCAGSSARPPYSSSGPARSYDRLPPQALLVSPQPKHNHTRGAGRGAILPPPPHHHQQYQAHTPPHQHPSPHRLPSHLPHPPPSNYLHAQGPPPRQQHDFGAPAHHQPRQNHHHQPPLFQPYGAAQY